MEIIKACHKLISHNDKHDYVSLTIEIRRLTKQTCTRSNAQATSYGPQPVTDGTYLNKYILKLLEAVIQLCQKFTRSWSWKYLHYTDNDMSSLFLEADLSSDPSFDLDADIFGDLGR